MRVERGSLQHDAAELLVIVEALWHVLEPHHGAEVSLQALITRVVPARPIEAVGIFHMRVAKEFGIRVLRSLDVLHLLFGHRAISGGDGLQRLPGEKRSADGVISLVVFCGGARRGVTSRSSLLFHQVVHVARESREQGDQLLLLEIPKHKVEVHVEELQVEISGDEAGEAAVVIVFVDVKVLDALLRRDHEAVASQCFLHAFA